MMNQYQDYKVIKFVERKHNTNYYEVQCIICGHKKVCGAQNLARQNNEHSPKNCKEDYYKGFINKKFGEYECIGFEYSEERKGFDLVMKCSICGHTTITPDITERFHDAYTCKQDFHNSFIGQKFGDLIVRGVEGYYKTHQTMKYSCECLKCGIKRTATLRSLKADPKHGIECFKQIPESDYKKVINQRFANMYQRCNNPNNTNYKHYGGRGIKLKYEYSVDLYLDFIDELKEHSKKYGLRNSTFDRIDPDGDYEKSNLRIANQNIQSTNTTRKRIFIIEKDGNRIISDNTMECGKMLNVNGRSLGNVIRGKSKSCDGWTLYRIVEENEDIDYVSANEGVTTKLITT